MTRKPIRCDIFCAVVDNYGDAAVCWRLANQLAIDHDWRIRLWIDNLSPLQQLAPDYATGPVEVRPWTKPWSAPPARGWSGRCRYRGLCLRTAPFLY